MTMRAFLRFISRSRARLERMELGPGRLQIERARSMSNLASSARCTLTRRTACSQEGKSGHYSQREMHETKASTLIAPHDALPARASVDRRVPTVYSSFRASRPSSPCPRTR